ncbi:MAG: 3'-5' exoribonuclease YhaM family protein [Desulfosudaceae bacterium]
MKKIFVDQLAAGQAVDDVFVLAAKTSAQKKDGNRFLRLVLTDRTGSVAAVVWDNVEQADQAAVPGAFVRAGGEITEYRGALQFTVKSLAACDRAEVDPADFLPRTDKDVNAMFRRLLRLTEEIHCPHLKALLHLFWNDDVFVAERFKRAPAAKHMHHAYLGGLVEHTLAVAELALAVCRQYPGRLDRDMLLAGAILHDVGKTREFEYDARIEYTDEGRLLNHLVTGIMMVEEKLAHLPDFPEETALRLKHLIASHHGSREFGSPEPPKTLEALVLNHIDEIDAKIVGIEAFMAGHAAGDRWTGFHRPMERFFYLGGQKRDGGDVHNT